MMCLSIMTVRCALPFTTKDERWFSGSWHRAFASRTTLVGAEAATGSDEDQPRAASAVLIHTSDTVT